MIVRALLNKVRRNVERLAWMRSFDAVVGPLFTAASGLGLQN